MGRWKQVAQQRDHERKDRCRGCARPDAPPYRLPVLPEPTHQLIARLRCGRKRSERYQGDRCEDGVGTGRCKQRAGPDTNALALNLLFVGVPHLHLPAPRRGWGRLDPSSKSTWPGKFRPTRKNRAGRIDYISAAPTFRYFWNRRSSNSSRGRAQSSSRCVESASLRLSAAAAGSWCAPPRGSVTI